MEVRQKMVTQERSSEQARRSHEAFLIAGSVEKVKFDKAMETLFLSYEDRATTVGVLIKRAFELLKDFHLQQERNIVRLREKLAKGSSLRRKDFDSIMSGVVNTRRKKEEEVRDAIDSFLAEEEEFVKDVRRKATKGEGWNARDLFDLKEEIESRQKVREKEIYKILLCFQSEEEELGIALRRLIGKEELLKVKDFTSTIRLLEQQNSARNGDMEELLKSLGDIRESIAQDWRGLRLTLQSGSPLSP